MQNHIGAPIAVLALIVMGCMCPKPKTDSTSSPASPAPQNQTISAETSAADLTRDYEQNELAADKRYKGKLVVVRGKISNIAETFGNVTVQLEGHDFMHTVMCSFDDSQRDRVSSLSKGQQTQLIGTVEGSTGGLYVGLDNCRVK